ncbi:MAG: dTDP-glucose 4,6-dehydratase [Pseudomonadota bacterium]
MILVTGGAGFIGSHFVRDWLSEHGSSAEANVLNIDKLSYAGNRENLADLRADQRHIFVHGDVGDRLLLDKLLAQYQPRALIHFAAESHVDRSINSPELFIQNNIVASFHLLESVRHYHAKLSPEAGARFRFLQVSTDEVYGSLSADAAPFTETHAYQPNSPYAASKAAADHLVRAYHHTYKLPVLTTHCSNNYGPNHFPEKLIPLSIQNALAGKTLPLYGDGEQIRDWLYVSDHCAAIRCVLEHGRIGERYNIGGANEQRNRDVVNSVCAWLDQLQPRSSGSYREQIRLVSDRPGHDRRYAIDASKIERELGWRPRERFHSGIEKTVRWYLANPDWVAHINDGSYRQQTEQSAPLANAAQT